MAVLEGGGSPADIARALAAGPIVPDDLRPPVAPDAEIIAAVAAEIGSDSLRDTLRRIERSVLRRDDPNYRLGDLSAQTAIAAAVDDVRELPLLDRWTYDVPGGRARRRHRAAGRVGSQPCNGPDCGITAGGSSSAT